MNQVLRATDVAEKVGYPVTTVNRWCRTGKLPATKHGHHWFVREQDLEALFDPFSSRAVGPSRSADGAASTAPAQSAGDPAAGRTLA